MKSVFTILAGILVATGGVQAEVIKCLDKDGNVIFTDTSSPECVQRADQPKPGAAADGTGGASAAGEPRRTEQEAQQAEQDRILLLTYQSVEEIEAVRDRRVDQVESRNFVTEHYLDSLRQQLADMEAEAANLRAAGSEPGSPAAIPPALQQDIESTRASIDDYEKRLEAGRQEQERIRDKFAADIARFQELRGSASTR